MRIILLLFLTLTLHISNAQDCYDRFLEEGISAYEALDYEAAIRKLEAAKICADKPNTEEVDQWLQKTITARFNALTAALTESDSLRREAETQRAVAEQRLEQVLTANRERVTALLRNAEQMINELAFGQAAAIIQEALSLQSNPEASLPAAAELVFFFTEAGKARLAYPVLEKANPLVPDMPALTHSDTLRYCKAALPLLVDEETMKRLEAKYYPVMKPVKGGTFWMGSEGEEDETAHQVTLSSFAMAQTELTALQYHLFVTATGIESPEGKQLGKQPLTYVSWYDALEYCNWLSQQHGLRQAYRISKEEDPHNENPYDTQKWTIKLIPTANGYRLPTEAEWEYAAGGGIAGRDEDGRRLHRYAGSNQLQEVAWYQENSESSIHPVMEKAPNELDLYDMSGNVMEWCWDWYDKKYYAQCKRQEVVKDPQGPESGTLRVYRGGSWHFFAEYCRVADRDDWIGDNPGERIDILGFRPVRK